MARLQAGIAHTMQVTVTNYSTQGGQPAIALLYFKARAGIRGQAAFVGSQDGVGDYAGGGGSLTFPAFNLNIPAAAIGYTGLAMAEVTAETATGKRVTASWIPLTIVAALGADLPFTVEDVRYADSILLLGYYAVVIDDWAFAGFLSGAELIAYHNAVQEAHSRLTRVVILGDVNGDGLVNMGDVTALKILMTQYPVELGISTMIALEMHLMGRSWIEPAVDINGDGVIDLGDILALQELLQRGDVNKDGRINIGDVTAIKILIGEA